MSKIIMIVILTFVWALLAGEFNLFNLAVGLVLSVLSLYFVRTLLPAEPITGVKLLRLAVYPFYIIGQIYLASFAVIKMIFTNAEMQIVQTETTLKNDFLRTLLGNSITLTPGTILLDRTDTHLTVLRLHEKSDTTDSAAAVKGTIEQKLTKIEKVL
ncbi:MAG: Na+/H+ antiporter subunit E [Firmicutes bacterium]|nr:Na+/H+ antiporter subunit E [Bacillota bacterium]